MNEDLTSPGVAGDPTSSRVSVLICDDHLVFAESLALVLGDAGLRVVAVTRDAAGLLTAVSDQQVDVCVLDVSLPDGSILGYLDQIRARCPSAAVVLLTGHLDAGLAAEALRVGVRGIVHKGQHVAAILETIAAVTAGEIVVDPVYRIAPATARSWSAPDARRLGAFLTRREREVLCRLVRGEDTALLARGMGITRATARCHVQAVLTKLGAHSRLEAATIAVRGGLVSAETGEWLVA